MPPHIYIPSLPLLAVPLVACSPGAASSSLDTLTCGELGPARILAAPSGESIRVIGEVGDRYVVAIGAGAPGIDGARVSTVGKCGEDPQALPEAGVVHIDEGRLWVVQGDRVGHWPAEGGAVTWESTLGSPVGLVPGRGFLMVDPNTRAADLLPGDGTQQPILSDVFIDSDVFTANTFETRLIARFQSVDTVIGVLDDHSKLHVVDVDDPAAVHVVPDVGMFALGPDATWFVTRAGVAASTGPGFLTEGEATFHVRGGSETVALGGSQLDPTDVHPTGWVHLGRGIGGGDDYFDVGARMIVPAPLPYLDGRFRDDAGGIYGVDDGAIVRWDPFTQALEDKGPNPEGATLQLVHDSGALASPDTMGLTGVSLVNARVVIAPFDGSGAWTIPGRVDGAWLLPGPAALYTPAVAPEQAEIGSLLWIDADGEPRELDSAAWLGGLDPARYDATEHDVTFRVDDGERSGLWRAMLP